MKNPPRKMLRSNHLTWLIQAVAAMWILATGGVLAQIPALLSDRPAFQPHGQPETIKSKPIESPTTAEPAPLADSTSETEIPPSPEKQFELESGSNQTIGKSLDLPEHLIDQPNSQTLVGPIEEQGLPARTKPLKSDAENERETDGGLRLPEHLIDQPTDSRTLLTE